MNKLKMGMVGGGEGAFIGAIHRHAAFLDGNIELVCGAFSSNKERSISSGLSLHLPRERCYSNYQEMIICESKLPKDEQMDFLVIVTPNDLHFPIAKMAIEYGFHVLSDKPATKDLQEALLLEDMLNKSESLYGLTHVYTGYPLIKQAKYQLRKGDFGKIVKVVVEYSQGWLSSQTDENTKQASWRLDPSRSGISCCMGDIGVHAANLVEYVCGEKMTDICADLTSIVDGRVLDDDGTVLFKLSNGAKGLLFASQVAVGEENNLVLKVYGEHRSLEWQQQSPNSLIIKSKSGSINILRTGMNNLCHAATLATRTPLGHPEGYLEAFANIYLNFAKQIIAKQNNQPCSSELFDVPSIEEAVRGMAFIENVVLASQSDRKWHNLDLNKPNKWEVQ